MKKRLLSLALALVLCLGLTLPASAVTMTEIVSAETFQSILGDYRSSVNGFSDGITWLRTGAFDTNGKIIIQPGTYSPIGGDFGNFSDGVVWVSKGNNWCVVDNTGKELFTLPIEAYAIEGEFHDGLAKVKSKETEKYGYVDKTGKLAIPCEYDSRARDFHDGLAVVYDSANAFFGYIDKTGKLAIPFQYSDVNDFDNGVAKVRIGDHWTYIDTTGKELLPQGYNCYDSGYTKATISTSAQAMAAYGSDGYAFFNKSGQLVSGGYDDVQAFSDGMALVEKDRKYGYVNESGVLVIPCQYSGYDTFHDGYAAIFTGHDGSKIIIDKTGKVTGTVSGDIGGVNMINVGNGCFQIHSSETGRARYGLVDYTGKEIVPCKYALIGMEGSRGGPSSDVLPFSGGVAAVKNFDGKWGFVDTTGAEIVPCQYSSIVYTNEPGIFEAWTDGRACLLKASGWTAPAAPSTPTTTAPAQPSGPKATPTASTVLVNGKSVAFDAYNIDGSNYFKLRDLAYTLNGTEKQFEVGWDNASKTITLTSGQSYTANGSEMATGSGAASASASASKLLVDGKELSLTAYSINGNNYFKLRDIGEVFDFGIGWDNATKTITIDTAAGYTA